MFIDHVFILYYKLNKKREIIVLICIWSFSSLPCVSLPNMTSPIMWKVEPCIAYESFLNPLKPPFGCPLLCNDRFPPSWLRIVPHFTFSDEAFYPKSMLANYWKSNFPPDVDRSRNEEETMTVMETLWTNSRRLTAPYRRCIMTYSLK